MIDYSHKGYGLREGDSMKIKAYESMQTLKRILSQVDTFGQPLYSSSIEEHSQFLVFEQYSIVNSNRMTISIVLEENEGYTTIHFVASGSSQGWLFNFDWGSATRRKNRLQTSLTKNNIRFEILSQ